MSQLLMFLKADALLRQRVGASLVRDLLKNDLVKIESFQKRSIDGDLVSQHYAHVKHRAFYPWLVDYITISPVYVSLLTVVDNAVESLREQLGSTISQNAAPGSVRHTWGIYGGINCLHVSDSIESGATEVALWKSAVGIVPGAFDMTPEAFAEQADADLPNNTQHLRDTCAKIETARVATQEDVGRIVELLRQECPLASETELYRLAETVIVSGLR